jgi:fructose-1,6-bisphosphatase I
MPEAAVTTLARHIIEQERLHPHATGAFTGILLDLAFAAKLIAREVNKAGIVDLLGATDNSNVHGETVQKLDEYADEVIIKALDHSGSLCCMASEEHPDIVPIPDKFPTGNYVLLYDPLDGSSNIDVNVSIGTIFSIHRKISDHPRGALEDCLQPGTRQVAAGYIVYGSATMLVYTSGAGVHGFTLDPSIGEFVLSHPDMRIPEPSTRVYSVNEGNYMRWTPEQQRMVDDLKRGVPDGPADHPFVGPPFSARYIGSLVSDLHRILLQGGIFMYPATLDRPQGKLRLLYEAAPMAMLCEQAGGRASDGRRDILGIEPTELHQRTPLFMGARPFVDGVEQMLARK